MLHAALRGKKLGKAPDRAKCFVVLRMHPRDPRALGYLANVKGALGHAPEEWEALDRQALQIGLESLIAKTGLANACARGGEVEAARALPDTVTGRREHHCSEWRTVLPAHVEPATETSTMRRCFVS